MYQSTVFMALAALSIGASGIVLPINTILPTQTCEFQELKSNQSIIFGWQLAGAVLESAEKGAICNALPRTGLVKAGLDILNIKEHVCSPSSSKINATSALPMLVRYNSAAFTTMLTHVFPEENAPDFRYLCDNIRFVQLRAFMLNDAQIVTAICNKGGPGAQISPEPFTSLAKPNDTAVAAYRNTASKLFARNYAATASSPQQLKGYCNRAPTYQSNLEQLYLDPQAVSKELCSLQTVPTVAETQASIKDLTTQQFITVVENMSNVPGWNKWLCQQLNQNAIDATGLDGATIKTEICGHSTQL